MLIDDDKTLKLRIERTEKNVKDFYTRVYKMAENLGFNVLPAKKNNKLLALRGDIDVR